MSAFWLGFALGGFGGWGLQHGVLSFEFGALDQGKS